MTSMPLALTDDQSAILRRLAYPLPPELRRAFLEIVARKLADIAVLGEGIVYAAGRTAQREVLYGARFIVEGKI